MGVWRLDQGTCSNNKRAVQVPWAIRIGNNGRKKDKRSREEKNVAQRNKSRGWGGWMYMDRLRRTYSEQLEAKPARKGKETDHTVVEMVPRLHWHVAAGSPTNYWC